MSTQWNWSWVDSREDTNKSSNSVDQSGGTLYSYRAATRGQLSALELKASIDSTSTNINHQWRLWTNYIRPILDSLPAGSRDERWRPGRGLPSKIDALNFGVQGTTLFVLNDANATKASGRYWDSDYERPKTIAEAIEDLWEAVNDIDTDTTTTSGTSVSLEALWLAVGHHYQDSSLSSASTSLDARTSQLESNINQLVDDLYGASDGFSPWTFGVPLTHSVARNIDYLLKLHGITGGWQSDPSTVNHSAVSVGAHTHTYTDVAPMPSSTLTQGRTAPYTSLYNDILRIRWEISRTRGGANWYSDATDPVDAAHATLQKHVNYSGAGVVANTNPHGINYTNTGADTMLSNLARYTGMTAYTSGIEMPTYSSTNYVVQSTSLETAIGALDAALASSLGSVVVRRDYSYDRSHLSETTRANNPITINHNLGRKPLVQIHDVSPEQMGYFGQYESPASEVNIVHIDENSFEIWTPAEKIEVIALF